jgi:outer membrane lipase/esterase
MSFKFLTRLGAQRWRWAAALAGGVLLASCGGGTQIVAFVPNRVLAFGDELSTIEPDGRKYSINGYKQVTLPDGTIVDDPTGTLDCTRYPIWVQSVATSFGLVFDRCMGAATVATGQVLARPGRPGTAEGKVADFAVQIAAVQGAALNELDLALVMFGQNDILELYRLYPTLSESELMDNAEARAKVLGTLINELAKSGPAVVVVTTPDISFSPFALAENARTGEDRAGLISRLVAKFNNRMSVTLINDGHLIGLAYGDVEMQNVAKSPVSYGLTNSVNAACLPSAPLPNCTTATLIPAIPPAAAAAPYTWLWSDDLHPTPMFQDRLAGLAANRAHTNPF